MTKKIFFLLIILIFTVTNSFYAISNKEPKILWEKKPEKGFDFFPLDQDQSSDNFRALQMKGVFSVVKEASILKIDTEGNIRTEDYRPKNKNIPEKYYLINNSTYLFSNRYYIKEQINKFEFFNSDNKLIFSENNGNKIENCYITNENQLLINFSQKGKKNLIVSYDINNGNINYQISYSTGINYNLARFYFDEKRIVIYENRKDLSIYSIIDGKLINKIENFAKNAGNYDFFKYDNDVIFLSVQSHYICFLSLESGRLISSIKYRNVSKIDSLSRIEIKKNNGLYYLLLNSYKSRDISVVCIDPNSTKPLWEKYINTLYYVDFYTSKNNVILHDNDYVYCLDGTSGNEIWKSSKLNFIKRVNLINDLFIVNSNNKKDYYAFEVATGKVKWSLKLTNSYVNLDNIEDKYFLISDTKNIFKVEIETGQILWKVDIYKNIEYCGYVKDGKTVVVYFNKKRGIAEIGFESGREKWIINTKYDLVDSVLNGNKLYIADKKTVYGVNINTNEIFLKNELKFIGNITSLKYLKNKNQFVFFDKIKDLYFYDIDSNVISKKVTLRSINAKFIELKVIGDYLFITEINLAKSGYTIIPGITYLTTVDLKSYEVLYSLEIGKHEFGYLGNFEEYYYDKYGAYYSSEGLGQRYQNQVIFYPRKDMYSKNIMIIQINFNFTLFDHNPRIIAYQMFPDNAIPSENDIRNMEKYFIEF